MDADPAWLHGVHSCTLGWSLLLSQSLTGWSTRRELTVLYCTLCSVTHEFSMPKHCSVRTFWNLLMNLHGAWKFTSRSMFFSRGTHKPGHLVLKCGQHHYYTSQLQLHYSWLGQMRMQNQPVRKEKRFVKEIGWRGNGREKSMRCRKRWEKVEQVQSFSKVMMCLHCRQRLLRLPRIWCPCLHKQWPMLGQQHHPVHEAMFNAEVLQADGQIPHVYDGCAATQGRNDWHVRATRFAAILAATFAVSLPTASQSSLATVASLCQSPRVLRRPSSIATWPRNYSLWEICWPFRRCIVWPQVSPKSLPDQQLD